MGWICVTNECEILSTGLWNGDGIAFFSIASEITYYHDVFFSWLISISAPAYIMAFLILVITLVVSIMVSIKRSIINVAK